jgi:hypothetical protein
MTHKLIAGNAASITVITATVDLGSVAANTTEEETATVTGVKTGDFIVCQKPTLEAGLAILGARVSAANEVTLTVGNFTGGGIDEASETLQFLVIRPEGGSAASRVLI